MFGYKDHFLRSFPVNPCFSAQPPKFGMFPSKIVYDIHSFIRRNLFKVYHHVALDSIRNSYYLLKLPPDSELVRVLWASVFSWVLYFADLPVDWLFTGVQNLSCNSAGKGSNAVVCENQNFIFPNRLNVYVCVKLNQLRQVTVFPLENLLQVS